MHGKKWVWRTLLILLPKPHNIFRDRQRISLIYLLLNEGRKKKRALGNKGRTVTMRKKTLCDVYTKVDDEQVLRRTKPHRATSVYLVVHAIYQYRRKIIYNKPRKTERNKWEAKSYETQGEKCMNLNVWWSRASAVSARFAITFVGVCVSVWLLFLRVIT